MITAHPNRGLPLFRHRSSVFSPRRERTTLHIDTTFVDLAAAVAAVLFRYHGVSPVALGIGQSTPELVDVHVDARTTLAAIKQQIAALHLNGTVSPAAQAAARNPNFDVAVLESEPLDDGREDVVVFRTALGADALWRSRLLDHQVVRRFLDHVAAMLRGPDTAHVSTVPLLSPDEERELRELESGGPQQGSTAPVHVQVRDRALANPGEPALRIGSRVVTYEELNALSGRLSRALRNKGVTEGQAVGLCVSIAAAVPALLGVLKSGATVVPLDSTLPAIRLQSHIRQSGLRIAVVDASTRNLVSVEEPLCFDALDSSPVSQAADVCVVPADGSSAYVLFTSGSTGSPKGIAMPHRGLTNVIGWQVARSRPAPRTLQRTSLAFDVGMQEVFSTLCSGGCLVVADEDTRHDPTRLPAFIAANEIERIFVPPVSLYQMAATLDERPVPLPSLLEVYVAGEALRVDPSLIRMFRNVGAVLENQYGPTETHVATTYRLDQSSLRWPAWPPIGKPVPGVSVHVADANGGRVPVGVAGEIVVTGSQVADGYVNGESIAPRDFRGVYQTGDLARWLPSGDLEFLGRGDRQVKIRGYRIELGEIEAALIRQPGIRTAVAAALDAGETLRLAAWLVTAPGFPGVAAIRKRLTEVLPDYMIPGLGAFYLVDELPLTNTGKVNLTALLQTRPETQDSAVAASDVQAIVADIWRQELSLEHVGVDDNFVEIGGHSLAAIRIVSRLNERFGVSLPLRLLLRGGTVAAIAGRLTERSVGSAASDLVRCQLPDGRAVMAPSAAEAQYLWHDVFAHHSYGQPIAYHAGATIVDVGAHIGLYTLYAFAAAPVHRVVAIEPAPKLFDALKRNTIEYADRITYVAAAAGDEDSSTSMTYYPTLSGMSSLRADPTADAVLLSAIMRNVIHGSEDQKVLLRELDDIVAERLAHEVVACQVRRLESILDEAAPGNIDVLKIDVQRYEEPVLRGLDHAWGRVRQVVVEIHDEHGALERIDAFLRARGFTTVTKQLPLHADTVIRFICGTR